MSLIQQIVTQSNKILKKCYLKGDYIFGEIQGIASLMSRLSDLDVRLDRRLVSNNSKYRYVREGSAPVGCVEIFNSPYYTLVMFVLQSGTRIPLHNHPGMHGIIKVVHGEVQVTSYTKVAPDMKVVPPKSLVRAVYDENVSANTDLKHFLIPTKQHTYKQLVSASSEAQLLTPNCGNYHEIHAHNGPAAFVDLLTPPYDPEGDRDCYYYKNHKDFGIELTELENRDINWLINIRSPSDFWCDSHPYLGPKLCVDDDA